MGKPQLHNPIELGSNYGHLKLGHINMNNTYAGVMLRNGPPGQPIRTLHDVYVFW